MVKKIIEILAEQTDINISERKEIETYLKKLEDDSLFLEALESNGVDNWTWYDEAFKDYLKMKGEEEGDDYDC